MMRSVGALVGDALAVLLFVAIGLMQHATPLTTSTVGLVAWPFLVGMLLGHLTIRSWRAPFALWPHGVFIWAITIAAAMAIRTLFGAGTETSFIIVTATFLALFMLGWRAVASFVTRRERREVIDAAQLRKADGTAGTVATDETDEENASVDAGTAAAEDATADESR
ncbi:DUF3054 domain-containing protein [Brachybacterium nesterenkovii]|uniref:PROBABLE CONSERVED TRANSMEMBRANE PROTEIN n=1 Tax=Brachybacterium nesterenkovii TaxID=47847 RepID=A0A1X6X027_9MICO|nr:DUF3054 domain-containing protein [Brachybacterium nesterenkovii]SLM91681.1 PROBABLE CONSERVED TRANSMEMBRANE PROTEIN [Brachybacterium nesterenkovii]